VNAPARVKNGWSRMASSDGRNSGLVCIRMVEINALVQFRYRFNHPLRIMVTILMERDDCVGGEVN
jgi:hypothetical protein